MAYPGSWGNADDPKKIATGDVQSPALSLQALEAQQLILQRLEEWTRRQEELLIRHHAELKSLVGAAAAPQGGGPCAYCSSARPETSYWGTPATQGGGLGCETEGLGSVDSQSDFVTTPRNASKSPIDSSKDPAAPDAVNSNSVEKLSNKVYFRSDTCKSVKGGRLRRCWVAVKEAMEKETPAPEGRLGEFVASKTFDSVCCTVMIANAIFIAWSSDKAIENINGDDDPVMQALELTFCTFYTLELAARIAVHRMHYVFCPDWKWNLLDVILVITSIQDVASQLVNPNAKGQQNVSFLRVMRLMKMAKLLRIVRLMRMFRELRLILHSILGSLQAIFWALIMVLTILFIFGTCFLQGVTSHLEDNEGTITEVERADLLANWGSVSTAMNTLYKASTNGLAWGEVTPMLNEVGSGYVYVLILYIAFYTCVVTNTLTSLFVETAIANADKDKEHIARSQLDNKDLYVRDLKRCFKTIDKGHAGSITYSDFCTHLKDPEVLAFVGMLEIDLLDLKSFFAVLSDNGARRVDIDTFVVGCIKLKGSAKSVDLMDLMLRQREAHEVFYVEHKRFQVFCQLEFSSIRQSLEPALPGVSRVGAMAV